MLKVVWDDPIILENANTEFRDKLAEKDRTYKLMDRISKNHIGYLTVYRNRDTKMELLDNLNMAELPYNTMYSYINDGKRVYTNCEVRSILQDYIINEDRCNIDEILSIYGLEDYDTLDVAIASRCKTQLRMYIGDEI